MPVVLLPGALFELRYFWGGHKVSTWLLLWIFPVQAEKNGFEEPRTPHMGTQLCQSCTCRLTARIDSLLGGFFLTFPGLGTTSSLLCGHLGQGQSCFLVTVKASALVLIS